VLGYGAIPSIIADRSQNIHMVYADPMGPGISIKYLKLDQDGNFIISPKNISIHENNNYPHMAMDSLQYLHVVWHLEDPMGVIYSKLDTLGNYVIAPIAVVDTPEAIWPGHPRIAVDRSNRLHLVWKDQRQDSAVASDIYYKRGENESGVKEEIRLKAANRHKVSVSPNPFTMVTRIQLLGDFDTQETNLTIYDVSGRRVRDFILYPSSLILGATWDGRDDAGKVLPPGIYFLKLSGKPVGKVVKVRENYKIQ
jgi:hypothetical protein